MDYLWSPWRYQYVTGAEPKQGCFFCAIAAREPSQTAVTDEQDLVVARGRFNFVVLNRFPYTSGHAMVAPYQHLALLDDLADGASREMWEYTTRLQHIIRSLYRPEGMNIGMNVGACAGAGIAGHIHMHALPRWTGDASFMTTVGETRVLPEDLTTTWKRLHAAWLDH